MQTDARKRIAVAVVIFMVCLTTVAQLLFLRHIPETPNNDLAIHIASIQNFRDAFIDRQWLPRLQLRPIQIPDIPVFQFYASLLGYLALPFLAIKFKPLVALTLAVLLIRWVGAVAMYKTARLLSAPRTVGVLAAISYVLSPYVVSNLYGRVAVPEATAHAILPILLYGLVRLERVRDWTAIWTIAAALVGLSLAHQLFLLYGIFAGALFLMLIVTRGTLGPAALALVGAFLVTAFQWYPAIFSYGQFAADLVQSSPAFSSKYSSYSGLIGLPRSLSEEGVYEEGTRYFFTPSILTIPVLALLLCQKRNRYAVATVICLFIFLFLSFSPLDLWQFLPRFTWTVQFPYRLLAFVALFTALGMSLLPIPLKAWQVVAIALVLFAQTGRVLIQPVYAKPLSVPDAAISSVFANQNYMMLPDTRLTSPDGWVQHYALPLAGELMKGVVDPEGYLLRENIVFLAQARTNARYVRINGTIGHGVSSVNIWLTEQSSFNALDGVRDLTSSGPFSLLFRVPNRLIAFKVRVSCVSTASDEQPPCEKWVKVQPIELIPGNEIHIPPMTANSEAVLRLTGSSIFANRNVLAWLAEPKTPEMPVGKVVSIPPGRFEVSFALKSSGIYSLVTSSFLTPADEDPKSSDRRRLSLNLTSYAVALNGLETQVISSAQVDRIFAQGYERRFMIRLDTVTQAASRGYLVELPIAYSSLLKIYQHNVHRSSSPNDRGIAVVETNDLVGQFVVSFRWPWQIWASMAIGLMMLFLAGKLLSKSRSSTPNF